MVHPQQPTNAIQSRMVGGKVRNLDRTISTLRHDRARDGRQCEQEEQNEGCPHARQLAPQPTHERTEAQPVASASFHHCRICHGITHQITAPNLAAQVRSIVIIDSHHPVTSSTPIAIKRIPPKRCTPC